MAGMFGGLPVGNVGAMTGANVTPWLQMQQMLDRRTEFQRSMEERMAERQQAEELALSQLEFNRQAELARQQLDQQRLAQGAQQFQATEARLSAGQQQQGELARLGIAQDEQARADANRRYLESLKRDEEKEARARTERETLRTDAKTREEEERKRTETEKQRPAEAKAWVERETPYLEQEFRRRATDRAMGTVDEAKARAGYLNALRANARREYADDPEMLAAIMAEIDAMEQEDRQREYEDIKLGEARAAREGRERANEGKIDYQRQNVALEALQRQAELMRRAGNTAEYERLMAKINDILVQIAGE